MGIKSDDLKFSPDIMQELIRVFKKAELFYKAHADNQDMSDGW